MRDFIKSYYKTLLFFALVGLVGGFFTGLYILDSYTEELQAELLSELAALGLGDFPADILLGIITAAQACGYGLVLGALGIYLGKQVGLWRDEISIRKRPLILSVSASVVCGLVMILSDILYFGRYSEAIADSYATKPTVSYMLASVLYGGVIEEVMLRLFFLSLIAFILHKVFERGRDVPSDKALIISNIVTALLFAIGHLPATLMLLGDTPMIIARCFILNGGIGLIFGYFYRKHGLRYAMITHGGCHVISKLIWLLFI